MRSWSFNISASLRRCAAGTRNACQRRRAALGRRALPAGLRPEGGLAAGGEFIQQPLQLLGVEILVEVVVDLHHRRVDAGAEALHFDQRKQTVLGGFLETDTELL